MIDDDWRPFLSARGIDVTHATMSPMPGGEINDTWLVTQGGSSDVHRREQRGATAGRQAVLRHYRRTTEPAEIDYELSAIDHLARCGFPTPSVIPSRLLRSPDQRSAGETRSASDDEPGYLWQHVGGRPAALFTRADGRHPPERPGGYGTPDLGLGVRAARLAGELHRTLESASLTGARAPARDPWRQIGDFIAGSSATSPLFAELIQPLRRVHSRLETLYADPSDVPHGLIHNDIRPPNLLVDSAGRIVALLDFDDCLQTFLTYELGALVSNFGKDEERRVITDRVLQLITGYNSVRPLTAAECVWLPDLLIAHAGAEGVRVVSHWLTIGRTDVQLRDSYSVGQFLDLVRIRDDLVAALT